MIESKRNEAAQGTIVEYAAVDMLKHCVCRNCTGFAAMTRLTKKEARIVDTAVLALVLKKNCTNTIVLVEQRNLRECTD